MSNLQELLAQRAAIDAQITEKQRTERDSAIAQAKALMTEYGISIQDLAATRAGQTKRATVAAKFKDPDTGNTWSGRGLQPKWLKAKVTAGASLDSFRI